MKKQLFSLILVAAAAGTVFSGCYSTPDGKSRAGVPFVRDHLQTQYERSVPQLMDAARVVLKRNGQIVSDDQVTKTIIARVDTRTVWVKAEEVDQRISQLTVQARRKGGAADIELASHVDKEIALQLTVPGGAR
jgi:hypothetical protein